LRCRDGSNCTGQRLSNHKTRFILARRWLNFLSVRTLGTQSADKKLLLVLTDGQPADIDVKDERLLIEDAKEAVRELDHQGIFTYCINLDAAADAYVADNFSKRYTVIDNIARLPEQLPKLFMALTR